MHACMHACMHTGDPSTYIYFTVRDFNIAVYIIYHIYDSGYHYHPNGNHVLSIQLYLDMNVPTTDTGFPSIYSRPYSIVPVFINLINY